MKVISEHKENGATFTPSKLADFLASEILSVFPIDGKKAITVLDPACGDGELLLALGKAIQHRSEIPTYLTGYDLNPGFIETTQSRLSTAGLKQVEVTEADFLLEKNEKPQADIIIANPPYVRTQILGGEKSKLLALKYNLKGRVDLYYPFLIEMTHSLKEGGILGVITSNRYLFTKSGESIREFFTKHYDVIKVIDLGDTKIFENAAVLPAIFIGRKKKAVTRPMNGSTFLKVYEESNIERRVAEPVSSIYELLSSDKSGLFKLKDKHFRKTKGKLVCQDNDNNWQLFSEEEQEWVEKINTASRYRIKDLAKVRVGVKTTADNVFIRGDWEKDGAELMPEQELLLPLISHNNVQKWQAPFSTMHKILYTHRLTAGKRTVINLESYPKASQYLHSHKAQLAARTYVIEAKRNWFEIWVPQQPSLWPKAKLVFPDISEGPRFYFDTDGMVVDGNCYWISVEDAGSIDMLLLMQGIANSTVMAKYHDLCFNNRLYAGRRRYLTQYVENYPLPDVNTPIAKEIIAVVKELNASSKNGIPISTLETQLDHLVRKAFGLQSVNSVYREAVQQEVG